MLKKSLYFLLALPCLFLGNLDAYPQCSPELSEPVKMLYQLPETRRVIEKVEAEGGVRILWANFGGSNSGALWNGGKREVVIKASNRLSNGEKISFILFELHNAMADNRFEQLDKMACNGQISKNEYVLAIEGIEHQNALQTTQLLEKGIRERIFPSDARWVVPTRFEDHYRMQLEAGHAQAIAAMYDDLSSHRHYS